MGKMEKASHRAKPDVRSVLETHLLMNPERGRPLLVGIDQVTGQLFFTSATGLCVARDMAARKAREALDHPGQPPTAA